MSKKKIIALALGIGFVTFLAVYLGLFVGRETPPFEISKVYSLSLGEGEKVDVRYVAAVDLFGYGRKEVLMSYDVYSVQEQMVEGGLNITNRYKEAKVVVFSGNTTCDFQKLWEYSSGLTRQTAATGDFDGDGKLDVIVGGYEVENIDEFPASTTSRVEVLLQEDGSFGKGFSANISAFLPCSIVAGDFDGNGRMDFVVSGLALESKSPYHAYLFRNEGGGNFTMSPIALREGIVVDDMWKADTNSDGSPDLVIHALDFDDETYSLILLLNNGRADFEFRELDVPVVSIVIGDFTGDRYPDIMYTNTVQSVDKVYFLRNEHGEFAESSPIDMQGGGMWLDAIIAGDFNNDGTLDVILLERSPKFREDLGMVETSLTGHLFLIRQATEAKLSFTPEWFQKFLEEKGLSPKHAAVAADMNGDERIDLILVSGEGEVYLALNQHT